MAPKPNGIEIHLDKIRHLRLGLNALAALENELGASIQSVFSDIESVGFTHIRGILWAGLLHEMPDLTVVEAGELFEVIPESALAKGLDKEPEEVSGSFAERNEYLILKIGEAFGNDVASSKKKARMGRKMAKADYQAT